MPVVSGLGRVWNRLTSGIIGIGVGAAISPAISPYVEELVQESWQKHPARALDPQDLAQAAVKFPGKYDHYEAEATRSGTNNARFRDLVEIANNAPGSSELLDLWRRGLINEAQVKAGLRDALMNEPYVSAVVETKDNLLSPADLAAARQQGFVDEQRQKDESAKSGFNHERAEILFKLAGLPPGPMDGLTMLRRGIIDEHTYRQIVAEGNMKVKYTDDLLALKEDILTPAEIVNAVVQNQLSREDGIAMAARNGITARDFDIMFRTRGNPPGVIQGIQLLRRGVITRATFDQIVAESATKTKYTDALSHFQEAIPSIIQIKQLVGANAISDELAIKYLKDSGYSDTIAHGIVVAAHAGKTAKHRDLAESLVLGMFEAREMTMDEALHFLSLLGYSDQNAHFVLNTIEAQRRLKFLRAIIETIHKRYVSAAIDESTAHGLLANQVPDQAAVNEYLDLWRHERAANVRRLTPSELHQALKNDLLMPQDVFNRLTEMGYPNDDAALLVSTWWGSTDWSTLGPTPPAG